MTEETSDFTVTIEQALAGSTNIAAFAELLVRKHQVDATPSAIDEWADDVSRLSDAEVHFDGTEEQLVALVRGRVLTTDQALRLQVLHLRQKQSGPAQVKLAEWLGRTGGAAVHAEEEASVNIHQPRART